MRFVVYLALFVFPLLASADLYDFLFTDPPTWNCVYRGSHESFTLREVYPLVSDRHILIDGKYKVFYRKTEDLNHGVYSGTYTNKGFTYELISADGGAVTLVVRVKPNNQATRVAECET